MTTLSYSSIEMSTRSIISLKRGREYFCTYCHYDGYFDGVGYTLAESFSAPEAASFLTQFRKLLFISFGVVVPFVSEVGTPSLRVRTSRDFSEAVLSSFADYVYVYDLKSGKWFGARASKVLSERSQRVFQRIKKESKKAYEPLLSKTRKNLLLDVFSVLSQAERILLFSERDSLPDRERRDLASPNSTRLFLLVKEPFIRSIVSFAKSSEKPQKDLESLIRLLEEKGFSSLRMELIQELLKSVPEKLSFSLAAKALERPQSRRLL